MKECRALALSHGFTIPTDCEFVDRDYTGRAYWLGCPVAEHDVATTEYLEEHNVRESKRCRPRLTELIRILPHLDVILCRDVTRLARPVPDSMLGQALRQEIQKHGVRIFTVMDGELDSSSFAHRIAQVVIELSEDHKITQQVAASKASLKQLQNTGSLYHSPYAYGFVSIGKQKVAPIPHELTIVRRIYDLALDDKTVMSICRTLNSAKVPTKRSTPEKLFTWTYRQIMGILSRPVYCGCQIDSSGELIPSKPYEPHAIVTQAEFKAIRKKLAEHRRYPRTVKAIHPLSTLLKCGRCGHNLTICQGADYDTGERVFYYRCYMSNYEEATDRALCRYSLIRESLTGNPWGVGILESLMPLCATGLRAEMAERRMDKTMLARRDELRSRLEAITKQERQIYNDALSGVIDEPLKISSLAERREQRLAVEAELKDIQARLDDIAPSVGDVRHFTLSLTGNGIDRETYRRLIRKAVKEIKVFPYAIEVTMTSGQMFRLDRIPDRNARLLPRVGVEFSDPADLTARIQLCYLYKSALRADPFDPQQDKDRKETILLDSPDFRIIVLGRNPEPYARTREKKKKTIPA